MNNLYRHPTFNDEVLVIEDNAGKFYVIGVLAYQEDLLQEKQILSDGTYASVNTTEKRPEIRGFFKG